MSRFVALIIFAAAFSAGAASPLSPSVDVYTHPWFLTHAEIIRLTPAEQRGYLRGVQKILAQASDESAKFASLSETSPARSIAAETSQINAKTVASLIGQAIKWHREATGLQPGIATDPKARSYYQDRMRNSAWWATAAQIALNTMSPDDPEKIKMKKDIDDLAEKMRSEIQKSPPEVLNSSPLLRQSLASLEVAQGGKINLSCAIIPNSQLVTFEKRQVVQLAQKNQQNPGAESDLCLEGKKLIADKTNPAAENTQQPIEKPTPSVPPVTEPEDPPQILGYRCMYAGFVIQEDPCRGSWEMPLDLNLKGIESAFFVCAKNEILCNPLLFGVRSKCQMKPSGDEVGNKMCLSQATPHCVLKGKYATRECAKKGNSQGSLDAAAFIIKMNPDMWRRYRITFFELCDDEMIAFNGFAHKKNGPSDVPQKSLDDIRQTCGHARKRLTELAEKYRVDDSRPERKTPETTSSNGQK